MRYYFIVNPYAGKGNKTEKLIETIKEACEKRGLDHVVYLTTAMGDAERYVREVCGQSRENGERVRIFACGGDGTINECFNGAADYEGAALGVIPIGTGNDFVRNFGGSETFRDIEGQLDANVDTVDLIRYNDRYCVNMINIGFDCEAAARTAKLKTNPLVPSKFAYIFGLLGEFIKKSGTAFTCKLDGEEMGDRRLLLSLFANGGFCGGGFYSAPKALLSDGLMDYCFIRNISRFRFLSLVGKYKSGTHLQMKNRDKIFEYGTCREAELSFGQTRRICVDGEIEECDTLRLCIVKDAVRFLVPASGTRQTKKEETEAAR